MKNILMCVSGLTPQIITETLFCLSVKKKVKIDELYVITTSRGRDVLLGIDEEYNNKKGYPALRIALKNMCERYKKISLPKFEHSYIIVASEPSIELPDIRNDKDNMLFPNTLCEFINEKTRDRNNILHCSISGGRKSMSVDMAFALSLLGRENDKLWHVLTHQDNEFKGFFPENKKQENDLEIGDIPFVRLRSIIGKETGNKSFTKMSYTDIVSFTQKVLKKAFSEKLSIDKTKREICYGENEPVRLEPGQLDLYMFFINSKSEGDEFIKINDLEKHGFKSVLPKIKKLNDKIREAIKDIDNESMFVIQGPTTFGKSNYGIIAGQPKFKIIS